jgi:hypothetical protein
MLPTLLLVLHVCWLVQVILIHLSNLTGLADDYNKRTMSLLVSDIGTIVMGITAAIASGYVKVRKQRYACLKRSAGCGSNGTAAAAEQHSNGSNPCYVCIRNTATLHACQTLVVLPTTVAEPLHFCAV